MRNNIIPFPGIVNAWALMKHLREIKFLCLRIHRQAERIKSGHAGTIEELVTSIRLIQSWGERMEVLLIRIHEAAEGKATSKN